MVLYLKRKFRKFFSVMVSQYVLSPFALTEFDYRHANKETEGEPMLCMQLAFVCQIAPKNIQVVLLEVSEICGPLSNVSRNGKSKTFGILYLLNFVDV